MQVLILGGDGMLGHELLLELAKNHKVTVSLRQSKDNYHGYSLFSEQNALFGVDARDSKALGHLISRMAPEVVINAVGIVKQREASTDVIQSLEVNALLPHRLAELCAANDARLIHISTDCVFSGSRGGYHEEDTPDATDLYGRTKLLGEVSGRGCLTLRSSIIGLELKGRQSLVEWYLRQSGEIPGFTHAIFSGLTTMEFGRLIHRLITEFTTLEGLFHVASEPISKYDILRRLTELLGRTDVRVVPNGDFRSDRSLNARKFEQATHYWAPAWDDMLLELSERIRERWAG